MHTTISVLEGIASYSRRGHAYRVDELLDAGDVELQVERSKAS